MGNSKLLDKSDENIQAAKLLVKNEWYNAATTRVYYSLYQKIIHILDDKSIKVEVDSGDSHVNTLEKFREEVITTDEESLMLDNIKEIKRYRKKCDYLDFKMTNPLYKNAIEKAYFKVEQVLDKHIQK